MPTIVFIGNWIYSFVRAIKCLKLSPTFGGSILMTSAPKSERIVVDTGPAIKLPASITFKPSKRNFSDIDKYYTRTRTHCRKVLLFIR